MYPLLMTRRRRTQDVSWLPSDISGGLVWYDFSDITTMFQDSAMTTPVTADDDPIGAIIDKFLLGNNAIQATTEIKPTYKTGIQNGLSVARFAGGAVNFDFLDMSGLAKAAGSMTVAFAVNPSVDSGRDYFLDSANGRLLFSNDVSGSVGWYDGTWRGIAEATNVAQVLVYSMSGSSGELFRNGSSLGTADYAEKAIGDPTILGASFDGSSDPYQGDMFELVIYDSAILDADRISLETYLINKWSI